MAMLPLIFQTVQELGFMSAQEFADLVALSQVTPGPIAVNAATYVGFNYSGLAGALVATLGVCLPSFIMMLLVMRFIDRFNESRIVQGGFYGIRPVTVGLIGAAVIFVGETVLVNGPLVSVRVFTSGLEYFNLIPIAIFAVTIILTGVFKFKPIPVILIMGAAGALLCGQVA